MITVKLIWNWIKTHPWAIIVALVSSIGAFFLWKASSNEVASLDDAIQIRAATREIARKEMQAQMLESMGDSKKEEVDNLRQKITASKKRVMEIHNDAPLDDKSDDDIARLFTLAGF
jgi:hypothetical protein